MQTDWIAGQTTQIGKRHDLVIAGYRQDRAHTSHTDEPLFSH